MPPPSLHPWRSCSAELVLAHQGELGRHAETGDVPALFRHVHIAALVDAQEVGDEIRRHRAQDLAVAGPDHVHLVLGHEEGAASQNRLEAARLVGVDMTGEHVAVANVARIPVQADQGARGAVAHQILVDREPRSGRRGDARFGGPRRRAGAAVEGRQTAASSVAHGDHDLRRGEQGGLTRRRTLVDLGGPVGLAAPRVQLQ